MSDRRSDTTGHEATIALGHHDRMNDTEALMWSLEKDPSLRSTITVVFLLDGTIDRDVLTRRVERMTRTVPRLRQRVRSNTLSVAPPRWETDPNFDLSFHLWWVRAPGSATMRDVLSIAEPVAMSGFDRARPLWRAIVIEGLPNGRSAIVMKVHHSIADGITAVQLQLELFDFEPDADERELPPIPQAHVLSQPERFADAIEHQTRHQLAVFGRIAGTLLDNAQHALTDPATALRDGAALAASLARVARPGTHTMSPLMTERSLSLRFDTLTVDLEALRSAGRAAGGTLNDAFVAALARGMYRYHLAHDVDCDELRLAIPISMHNADGGVGSGAGDGGGNAFIPARVEIPIDLPDPVELMSTIHDIVDGARHEPANELVEPVSGIINRFPTAAVTSVFSSAAKSVDFAASNVPGPPVAMYLAGAKLLAQFPFGPLSGSALNATLLSYDGTLDIGIVSDPAAIADPEQLIACLAEGFEDILAAGEI